MCFVTVTWLHGGNQWLYLKSSYITAIDKSTLGHIINVQNKSCSFCNVPLSQSYICSASCLLIALSTSNLETKPRYHKEFIHEHWNPDSWNSHHILISFFLFIFLHVLASFSFWYTWLHNLASFPHLTPSGIGDVTSLCSPSLRAGLSIALHCWPLFHCIHEANAPCSMLTQTPKTPSTATILSAWCI